MTLWYYNDQTIFALLRWLIKIWKKKKNDFLIDIGAEITHLGALAGTEGQASHWVVERRWNGTTLRPPLSLWTWEEARLFQPPGVADLQPMYLISCFLYFCLYYLLDSNIWSKNKYSNVLHSDWYFVLQIDHCYHCHFLVIS